MNGLVLALILVLAALAHQHFVAAQFDLPPEADNEQAQEAAAELAGELDPEAIMEEVSEATVPEPADYMEEGPVEAEEAPAEEAAAGGAGAGAPANATTEDDASGGGGGADVPEEAPEPEATANETEAASGNATEESDGPFNQGVDACIFASWPATLLETAQSSPAFTTLVAAVDAAGLSSVFESVPDKVTVFAPTDDAFAAFFEASNTTADEVLANKEFLGEVLKYHVVPTVVTFQDLLGDAGSEPLPTALTGESLSVNVTTESSSISAFGVPIGSATAPVVTIVGAGSSAEIIQGNLWACNGVIQIIDDILVPQSAVSSSQ